MKKTDLAMLALVAGLSVGVGILVVSQIPMLKPPEKPVKVSTMELYNNKESMSPDKKVFTPDAINPTVQVNIDSQPKSDNGEQPNQ